MKILITGASGFLGSAIAQQAMNAGLPIVASDRDAHVRFRGMDYIAADILNPKSLSNMFTGIDSVCHVAGLAHVFHQSDALGPKFYAVNVAGAENVARAAAIAGVKNFLFISSVSVYGGESLGKDELSECNPESPYALSKWQAERTLIDLCQKEKINLTILRLATLYGEEDPGNVGRLIRLIDRRRFIWIGRGVNLKSLLYREDAARACVAVLTSPPSGIHIYNVAAPPCKMLDIVQNISQTLGKHIPAMHIPAAFALTSSKVFKGISFNHPKLSALHDFIQKWLADDYYKTDKMCRTFNFEAKVSLEEGMRREVAWYKAKLSKS